MPSPFPGMDSYAPYFVLLSRADKRPIADVWPVALDQPLPAVPVPLQAPDPDLWLDLQLVLTTIDDLLHYERIVDYSQPPEVPLTGRAAEWAREQISTRRRTTLR